MFKRVLIANRGEIALRVLRTCHEMGIETVAAYSKVDIDLLHLKYATDVVCIGERDYLSGVSMIVAAQKFGCQAIHPGYGFLSENAEFAALVETEGLTFIGPTAESISIMGDKAQARSMAKSNGLVTIAGSQDRLVDLQSAETIARQIGYPVVIKAVFGGGGRGIRIVQEEKQLDEVFPEAQREAVLAFGNGALYIERFLDHARHIEVQILGDGRGAAIHLGTRECSIQRKHQKLIEEAPATNIQPDLLDAICEKSVNLSSRIAYRGLGTLEFLYQDGEFFFLEMNTRIQVEHPVTESITGLDLVKLQLEVAFNNSLPLSQEAVQFQGHSIECRVNAEDKNFHPSPGLVSRLVTPGGSGIRIDSHLYSGYTVPHQYDSLMAKIVATAPSRHDAIVRIIRALGEYEIEGVLTNLELLVSICSHQQFQKADVDINFLERKIVEILKAGSFIAMD